MEILVYILLIFVVLCILHFASEKVVQKHYRIVPVKDGYYRIEEYSYLYNTWKTIGGRDWTKYYTNSLEKAEQIVQELRDERQREEARVLARQREQKQFRKNNPIRYF